MQIIEAQEGMLISLLKALDKLSVGSRTLWRIFCLFTGPRPQQSDVLHSGLNAVTQKLPFRSKSFWISIAAGQDGRSSTAANRACNLAAAFGMFDAPRRGIRTAAGQP